MNATHGELLGNGPGTRGTGPWQPRGSWGEAGDMLGMPGEGLVAHNGPAIMAGEAEVVPLATNGRRITFPPVGGLQQKEVGRGVGSPGPSGIGVVVAGGAIQGVLEESRAQTGKIRTLLGQGSRTMGRRRLRAEKDSQVAMGAEGAHGFYSGMAGKAQLSHCVGPHLHGGPEGIEGGRPQIGRAILGMDIVAATAARSEDRLPGSSEVHLTGVGLGALKKGTIDVTGTQPTPGGQLAGLLIQIGFGRTLVAGQTFGIHPRDLERGWRQVGHGPAVGLARMGAMAQAAIPVGRKGLGSWCGVRGPLGLHRPRWPPGEEAQKQPQTCITPEPDGQVRNAKCPTAGPAAMALQSSPPHKGMVSKVLSRVRPI